jgi:hypothetical protein
MIFSLDVIRARKGDCLLLHYGTADKPRLIVIDAGPSNVYKPNLRPRLKAIRDARDIPDNQPLVAEALMVSHVDDDHIKGVIDLTKELTTQQKDGEPRFMRAKALWHNTFDDLLNTTPEQLKGPASFGTAAINGEFDVESSEHLDAAKILASIDQGRTLRDDAKALGAAGDGWSLNQQFGGKLILASADQPPVTLAGDLKVTVLGPLKKELQDLQKEHDKFLKTLADAPSPEAALAAFVDKSPTNLSSIVMLVEAGEKKILLTGDARGDKILTGLEMAGLLAPGGTMHVDILKVPHHGSANNMATEFFERVTADHYVFSGNGEHGNPERETFEMLFEARGDAPMTIYVTYPIEEIDPERKKDWEKERQKEINKGKTPRPHWSNPKNSLRAFLDDNPLADGQTLVEIGDDAHEVIDLLDELKI